MKPIIFSGPMVNAILEGRKTQTRSAIKPQPAADIETATFPNKEIVGWKSSIRHKYGSQTAHLPKYQPGDVLWVKETWARLDCTACDGDMSGRCFNIPVNGEGCYVYKASHYITGDVCWRPSIHMPREAARLFLRNTGVRIERLQDIREEDAISEGVGKIFDNLTKEKFDEWNTRCAAYSGTPLEPPQDQQPYINYLWHGHFGKHGMGNKQSDSWAYQFSGYDSARDSYSSLWQLINAKRGFSWESNPWVWVYEFERISEENAK